MQCYATPRRATPWQAVPPLHTELQGCEATQGGRGRGGREGFHNFSPTSAPAEGAKPSRSPPCPQLGWPRSAHRARDVPWSWWQLVTKVAQPQGRTQGGHGRSPCPRFPAAGGGQAENTLRGQARAAPGSRSSPAARVLGPSGAVGLQGQVPSVTTTLAPPQPLATYPAWLVHSSTLCWSSFPVPMMPCGTPPRWTYQEVVAGTEPPHGGCAGAAGALGAALLGSPGCCSGLMFTHAGPSLATRCVTQVGGDAGSQPWLMWDQDVSSCRARFCVAMGQVGRCPPPARHWMVGGRHLLHTLATAWARLWITKWGHPEAMGEPLFWDQQAGCACVALCNMAVAVAVATANTSPENMVACATHSSRHSLG